LVEQIDSHIGDKTVVIHGFIKSVRKLSKKLVFLDLYDYRSGPDIIVQVVSRKEDVMKIVHKLICDIFYKAMGIDLPFGFRSMTYSEAMQSYGTDKPDLRHGFLKV
jgi:aspartyl-tRNA synthetase